MQELKTALEAMTDQSRELFKTAIAEYVTQGITELQDLDVQVSEPDFDPAKFIIDSANGKLPWFQHQAVKEIIHALKEMEEELFGKGNVNVEQSNRRNNCDA